MAPEKSIKFSFDICHQLLCLVPSNLAPNILTGVLASEILGSLREGDTMRYQQICERATSSRSGTVYATDTRHTSSMLSYYRP